MCAPRRWIAGALAVSLCVGGSMTSQARPVPHDFDAPAYALDILKDLIEIDTAAPRGSDVAAALLAERLRAAGFAERDLTLLAPPDHPTKTNLLVRLSGKGKGKPILFIAHLDVVAADAAGWSHPPFQMTEADGWIYGRGTADMKGEAAALATALVRLKREKIVPDRDIVVAFTADEEAAGTADGVRWLLTDHPDLLDASAAFIPDAGGGLYQSGKRSHFGIQTAEKTYASFHLTAVSPGGHSARPVANNAIERLGSAIGRIAAYDFPVSLRATTRRSLAHLAGQAPDLRPSINAILVNPDDKEAGLRLKAEPTVNAQLRTTCTTTLIKGGESENALPQKVEATLQCRLLPGETVARVQGVIEDVIADPAIHVALARPVNPAPGTDPDPDIMDRITDIVHQMWPNLPVTTVMDAGGSDAAFTRRAGIATYGVTSIFIDADDNRRHGIDERIARADFVDGVEFTYRLMRKLADSPAMASKRTD
jgi:acetylornithine deacetylase/succinyl-diaminopimelate desuccinylase-like protein